ncbi:MAG: hypothetical protein PF569_05385 [Candidatus Woesearchaeota archaeon]|jgi:hypothetical protein|nr:hypothetical protein [Candidatus Woesearchaeota archaeon]
MVEVDNISKYEYEEFLNYKKDKFQEKLKIIEKAKNDTLFLDDINSIQEDFSSVDLE